MTDNPCLRPACVSDVFDVLCPSGEWMANMELRERMYALVKLYTAEWRKRGFERSP